MNKTLPLSRGLAATVDDADFDGLSRYKWLAFKNLNIYYAGRWTKRDGRRVLVLMHRAIMDPPEELQVDHKNGDGLDNRRNNLRIATRRQNQHNKSVKRNGNCRYKGITLNRPSGRWYAYIYDGPIQSHIGRNTKAARHLGSFATPEEAAKAYDSAAIASFGEFARLNFPTDGHTSAVEVCR